MSALKYLYICQAKNDTTAFNVYEMTEQAVYVKDTKFIMPFISYRCNDMIVQYLTSNGTMFTQVPIQNKIPNAISAYKYNLHGVGFDLNKLCVHMLPSLSDVMMNLHSKTNSRHDELFSMIERLDSKTRTEDHELGMISVRLTQTTDLVSGNMIEMDKINARLDKDLNDIAARIIKNEDIVDSKTAKTEQAINALHDSHTKKITDIEEQVKDIDICLGGVVHKLDEVSVQSTNIKVLGNNVADMQCSISDHDTAIEEVRGQIGEMTSQCNQATESIRGLNDINDLITEMICSNTKSIREMTTTSEIMSKDISTLHDNVDRLDARVTGTMNTIGNRVENLAGLINMLVARMNKMELEMLSMQSTINEKDMQIKKLSSRAFINVNYMDEKQENIEKEVNDETVNADNDNSVTPEEDILLKTTIDPETGNNVDTGDMPDGKMEDSVAEEQKINVADTPIENIPDGIINTTVTLDDVQPVKSWWQLF